MLRGRGGEDKAVSLDPDRTMGMTGDVIRGLRADLVVLLPEETIVRAKSKLTPLVQILLAFGLLVASTSDSPACRYNVRETGFVDLKTDSYRLFCYVDSQVSQKQISQLQSVAAETFAHSSISLEVVSADQTVDHPALEYRESVEDHSTPSAALVSPAGHSLWLGPLWDKAFSPNQVRVQLQQLLSSPARAKIAEGLATAFGVVLLIEGKDPTQNRRARGAALQAIRRVEAELEFFPKPIERGPVLITLSRDQLPSERLLLWSFFLSPDDLEWPVVAVLYGRGRWIGPTMIGEEITLDLISRVLFVIGADCECGLDPRLLRGTGIPIPWDRRLQNIVTADLGFDPDNPLVKMEVSQILRLNALLHSEASAVEELVEQLQITAPKNSPGKRLSRLASHLFFYLIGGLAALVLCVGAFILIRKERDSR